VLYGGSGDARCIDFWVLQHFLVGGVDEGNTKLISDHLLDFELHPDHKQLRLLHLGRLNRPCTLTNYSKAEDFCFHFCNFYFLTVI
jgi:hypothetical protein